MTYSAFWLMFVARGRKDGSRVFKPPVVFIVLLDQRTCFTLAVGFRLQHKQLV